MTTTTLTLTDFLLARIAEDEAAAREYQQMLDAYERERQDALERGSVTSVAVYDFTLPGGAGDPARVLAECGAKRRIVELHTLREWGGWTYCAECNTTEGGTIYDVEKAGPCPTLRLLALPYADHPDYRAEWAVDNARPAPPPGATVRP